MTAAVLTAAALCLVIPVAAATAPVPAAATKKGTSAVGVRSTTILGAAWNADNSPIASARLRLRNIHTGRLVASTIANSNGQFTFDNIEGGAYVIELVTETGKVLATGQRFSVAPGETVATFVRLAARGPWFAGFFSNAAAAAITTASSLGVTAVGSDAPDVSPDGRPAR